VIWRVHIGTLALSTCAVPCLRVAAYAVGKYSLRRTVADRDGKRVPIASFRTQQRPILHAISQYFVLDAFANDAAKKYMKYVAKDPRVSHGIATALKSVMIQHGQMSLSSLAERCGAQGLFEHNQVIELLVRDMQTSGCRERLSNAVYVAWLWRHFDCGRGRISAEYS
jgi:acyl-CoA oxidase